MTSAPKAYGSYAPGNGVKDIGSVWEFDNFAVANQGPTNNKRASLGPPTTTISENKVATNATTTATTATAATAATAASMPTSSPSCPYYAPRPRFLPAQYLQGAVRLAEYVGLGKHIYLVGDKHVLKSTCPAYAETMVDFFLQMFEDAGSQTIDFFLEAQFAPAGYPGKVIYPDLYITRVMKYFEGCLTSTKDLAACPWLSHVRFHYADIRNLATLDEKLFVSDPSSSSRKRPTRVSSWFLQEVYNGVAHLAVLLQENADVLGEAVQKNIDNIAMGTAKEFHTVYYKQTFDEADVAALLRPPGPVASRRIQKQLDAISDAKIRSTILRSLKLWPFDNLKTFAHFVHKITVLRLSGAADGTRQKPYTITPLEVLSVMRDGEIFFNNLSTVMDLYLMARVFRDFPRTRGPGPSDEKTRRVIIYAGDAHIRRYMRIFEEIGLRKVTEVTHEPQAARMQCLDLQTFKQPFFQFSDVELDGASAKLPLAASTKQPSP